MKQYKILHGDCREVLKHIKSESIQCCITSPPYFGLRDYGVDGQIGLESLDEYIQNLCVVFDEVRRILKSNGTLWLNLGDSYYSKSKGSGGPSDKQISNRGSRFDTRKFDEKDLKEKDLIGVPWRVALALQARGWYLRQDIIWHKPNPMPESVKDRCAKAHEYVFLLSKSSIYKFNHSCIQEKAVEGKDLGLLRGKTFTDQVLISHHAKSIQKRINDGVDSRSAGSGMRNKRSVWSVPVIGFKDAHFATFPTSLIKPMILAGSDENDIILDPFNGAATTGLVSLRLRRRYLGVELNPEYI